MTSGLEEGQRTLTSACTDSCWISHLTTTEFAAQLEETYARATVALTRAQRLCIIMEPLDMKGPLGAATVIGCSKYGAGLCGFDSEHRDVSMHLRESAVGGPDDAAFITSLHRSINNTRGVYLPVAFAEIYRNDASTLTKIPPPCGGS